MKKFVIVSWKYVVVLLMPEVLFFFIAVRVVSEFVLVSVMSKIVVSAVVGHVVKNVVGNLVGIVISSVVGNGIGSSNGEHRAPELHVQQGFTNLGITMSAPMYPNTQQSTETLTK